MLLLLSDFITGNIQTNGSFAVTFTGLSPSEDNGTSQQERTDSSPNLHVYVNITIKSSVSFAVNCLYEYNFIGGIMTTLVQHTI